MKKALPWRAVLYCVVIGYLVLDLKVFHGPLRESMRSRRDVAVSEARERGWIALVNQEPVTREQVALALRRHLHQRGLRAEDLPAKNLAMLRLAALQTVIDETLVRQHGDGSRFQVPDGEKAAFVDSWKRGFASAEEREMRARAQGWKSGQVDEELARIWTRKRWVENRIEPGVAVSEEEARSWFEANRRNEKGGLQAGFFEPAKRELRQALFADEKDAQAAYQGEGGARVAFGEARWLVAGEGPAALADKVFAVNEARRLPPFRSEQGWHLVEVLAVEPERPLSFEELREEIIAQLEARYAEDTVPELLGKLRQAANLHLFLENL